MNQTKMNALESRLLVGARHGGDFLSPERHAIVLRFQDELHAFFGERLPEFEEKFDQVLRFMGTQPTLQGGKTNSDLDHVISMLCNAGLFLRNIHIDALFSDDEILRMLHTIALHDLGELAGGDIPINEKEQMSEDEKAKLDKEEHDYTINYLNSSQCSAELKDRLKGYFDTYCRYKNGGDLVSVFVKLIDMYDALITALRKGRNAAQLSQEIIARIRKYQNRVFSDNPKYVELLDFFDRAITNAEGVLSARIGQGVRYYQLPYGAIRDAISGEEKSIISWRIACMGWLFCTVNIGTEDIMDQARYWQWDILAGLTPVNHPRDQ